MSRHNSPVATIAPNARVTFFTEDCYSGTVRTARDRFPKSKERLANPATGPVFVRGVKPGHVLAVKVVSVEPVGKATMLTGPGKGPLGYKLTADSVGKLPIEGGFIRVGGKCVKLAPMIGVIGVAPKGKPLPNTWPGEHGGNMDCNVIRAGSIVYLPVYVEGALLALGDVHAVQAAGEVAICAAECKGRVTVEVAISRRKMITPAVSFGGDLYILASAKTLDRAEALVLDKAYTYLTEIAGMKGHGAVRFMSLACDMEICQVVDPLKTLRVRIPGHGKKA
jgi:amidase